MKCKNQDCPSNNAGECASMYVTSECVGLIPSDEDPALNSVDSLSAGWVSSSVAEIKDPELLSQIKEMFNDAEEALRLAVETRLNSESWKNSQKLDGIPKH